MKNNKCPYCQATVDPTKFDQHLESLGCRIETEINSDPTLRFNLREAKMDYRNLSHQVDIQIANFKIALHRAMHHKFPTSHGFEYRKIVVHPTPPIGERHIFPPHSDIK